jgi:hypothetical protein
MVGSLIAAVLIVVVTIALVIAKLGESDELRDGDGKSDDNSGPGSGLDERSGPLLAGAGIVIADRRTGSQINPETGKTPFHEL